GTTARTCPQLIVGLQCFLIACGSAAGGSGSVGVRIGGIKQRRVVCMRRDRDCWHPTKSLSHTIGRIAGADPESQFEGPSADVTTQTHKLGVYENARQASGLLKRKKAKRVADKRGNA